MVVDFEFEADSQSNHVYDQEELSRVSGTDSDLWKMKTEMLLQ